MSLILVSLAPVSPQTLVLSEIVTAQTLESSMVIPLRAVGCGWLFFLFWHLLAESRASASTPRPD